MIKYIVLFFIICIECILAGINVDRIPFILTNTPSEYKFDINEDIDYSNNLVWVGFRTIVDPNPTNYTPNIQTSAAAFYIDTNKKLYANNDTNWIILNTNTPTNILLSFVVQLDYNTKYWNLYYGTNSKAPLLKLNTTSLAFNTKYSNDIPEISNIHFEGENIIITNFSILRCDQTIESNLTNLITSESIGAFIGGDSLLSSFNMKYFSTGTGFLHSTCGKVLSNILFAGDRISLYTPSDGAYRAFEYNGIDFNPLGSYSTTNTPITNIDGARITLSNVSNQYFNITNRYNQLFIAYNTLYSHTNNVQLIPNSFHLAAFPLTLTTNPKIVNGISNFKIMGASTSGDRMYVRSKGVWIWIGLRNLNLNGTNYWVRTGTRPANETFYPGDVFWYRTHTNTEPKYMIFNP